MSRIGIKPVTIPAGVTVTVDDNNNVTVKGPKGTLEKQMPAGMEISWRMAGIRRPTNVDTAPCLSKYASAFSTLARSIMQAWPNLLSAKR